MPIKSVKMKISKIKKTANGQTHESDYCGHPFRVSGVFPSTYHQGSSQYASRNIIVKARHYRFTSYLYLSLSLSLNVFNGIILQNKNNTKLKYERCEWGG